MGLRHVLSVEGSWENGVIPMFDVVVRRFPSMNISFDCVSSVANDEYDWRQLVPQHGTCVKAVVSIEPTAQVSFRTIGEPYLMPLL